MLGKIIKRVLLGLMAIALVVVGLDMFFGLKFDNAVLSVGGKSDVSSITVVEPLPMISFEPTIFDPATRQRLNNIYETLVRPDRDLNMEPSLALSWGLLDDITWEIKLRSGVKFHDGSDLKMEDVLASIDRARNFKDSALTNLLSTIKEVKKIDEKSFQITTQSPDPLLLQRLSTIYIVKADFDAAKPIGTGPFMVDTENMASGAVSLTDLVLNRFDNYWGGKARFKKADFVTIQNSDERMAAFLAGKADILDYVPYDYISQIDENIFDVTKVPSLEVQFMLFNFKNGIFKNLNVRKAVAEAVNQYAFADFIGAGAHGVNQFISSGIFGYNNAIPASKIDSASLASRLADAKKVVEDGKLKGAKVSILLPLGLDSLGDFLNQSLTPIGLETSIQYVKGEYFEDTVKKVSPDMYFMGFKSELGDASDFLKSVAHTSASVAAANSPESYGQYNFSGYSNLTVDGLIEKQEVTMDAGRRLNMLQDAMKGIVSDDVIGIPLFEYDTVFASKQNLDFEPRIDGFIYLKDL